MDQQNGAPASAVNQAARTVLPGEPFEPPMAAQVPGPRQDEQAPVPPPVAHWNYPAPEQAYGAPSYQDAPVAGIAGMQFVDQTQMQPPVYPVDAPAEAGDFSSLHEYASLPVAQPQEMAPQAPPAQGYAPPAEGYAPVEYPQSPPESTWPPAAPLENQPQAFSAAYPPPPQQYAPGEMPEQDALPPLPPPPMDDDSAADNGHRRSGRRSIDKRLLAVIGVVVVAGGGYLLYNQFGKSDSSSSSTPAPAVAPVAPRYDFPADVSGFTLQPAASAATLKAGFQAEVKKEFGAAAAASVTVASYSPGHPAIYAMTFRPGATKMASAYKTTVAITAAPDPGNVAVAAHSAVPGAAGGTMVCGGESGSQTSSWCVWHNGTTIGITAIEGSPKTQITEIITREMRAYAEH